jgi:DNA-directed RNA polymerase subunit M/transcription elongation factor TFIIS
VIKLDDKSDDREPCPKCGKVTYLLSCTEHFHQGEKDSEIVEIVECLECGAKFAQIYKFNRTVSLTEILRSPDE